MKTKEEVDLEDVLAAHERIRGALRPTPLIHSESRGALLKLENLQATGSYKVRGAFNAIALQIERRDHRPVVAASAGNHGKGVAWAARHFGLDACVVVPESAPRTKIDGAIALGAQVVRHGDSFEAAADHARELARRRDWRFLHPFDDPDVIAGQGTVALELLEFHPDAVLIPIGGGGLAAGMGLVLKTHGIRVIGVQVEGTSPIADGVRVKRMGDLTRRLCAQVVDEWVLVSDGDVRRTLLDLVATDRIVAEGAGAVAPAALARVSGRRKAAVVSGGNIDGARLFEMVRARVT